MPPGLLNRWRAITVVLKRRLMPLSVPTQTPLLLQDTLMLRVLQPYPPEPIPVVYLPLALMQAD